MTAGEKLYQKKKSDLKLKLSWEELSKSKRNIYEALAKKIDEDSK